MEPSRGQAGCGLVMLFRTGTTGEVARAFCKRRGCPDCGPRRCARLHRRYVQMLDDWLSERGPTPLVTFTIAPTAWASLARKLRRAGLPYQRLPLRDGTDRIITTDSLSRDVDLVADHHQLLAEVFTWSPEDIFETRRPSHAGWDLIASITETTETAGQTQEAPGAHGGEPPPKRELVGLVGVNYARAFQVLDGLGHAPVPIPETDLPDDWAEAHRFQLPPEDSVAWRQMVRGLRLSLPAIRDGDHLTPRQRRERYRQMYGWPAHQPTLPGIAA